jgi:hypothetical protein
MGSSASLAPPSFGHPVLDMKLDGSNYREWAFSLKMMLKYNGSASHLTDAPPVATTGNEEVKAWHIVDDRVMAIICMSTDLSIRSCLEDHKNAKETWDYLQNRAASKAAQPFAIHFVRIFNIFSSRTCPLRSTMLPSTSSPVKLPPWYPSPLPCALLVVSPGPARQEQGRVQGVRTATSPASAVGEQGRGAPSAGAGRTGGLGAELLLPQSGSSRAEGARARCAHKRTWTAARAAGLRVDCCGIERPAVGELLWRCSRAAHEQRVRDPASSSSRQLLRLHGGLAWSSDSGRRQRAGHGWRGCGPGSRSSSGCRASSGLCPHLRLLCLLARLGNV